MATPSKPTILITGGAGYIGSCTALCLHEAGYPVVILDNLSRGHRATIAALRMPFIEGSVGDMDLVQKLCREHKPEAVIHFAALAYVGESVHEPEQYFLNNTRDTLNFLAALRRCRVQRFVFSSTCATYGIAPSPLSEQTPQNPVNPYGRSKLAVEFAVKDYGAAYGLRYVIFRYFNVAGCHHSLRVGERHDPETHLIPRAISAALGGEPLRLFGADYPTADGTCVRDYIHVEDVADAHVRAVAHLLAGGDSQILNIGTGQGCSVKEVVQMVEKVSGRPVPLRPAARRAGDPPELVAAAENIRARLGWKARYSTLEQIVASAYAWHTHPAQRAESLCS